MHKLWEYIGIAPVAALAVVCSTVARYLSFIGLIRILGSRVLSSLSTFDLLVIIVLGAVIGRASLGYTPTLAAGLLCLLTLVILEGVIGQIRSRPAWGRWITSRPVLLMAGPVVLTAEVKRFHVTEEELRSALRQAGIRSHREVAAVILEPTGRLSVLGRGVPVDPSLLTGVRGADLMPPDLVGTE
jgi:uncharacterized membrane protein YcaP (DUF421 family)